MTWHYAIRDRRLAEVFAGLDLHPETGSTESYVILGWDDAWHILRDWRWVIRGIRYDRRKRAGVALGRRIARCGRWSIWWYTTTLLRPQCRFSGPQGFVLWLRIGLWWER